MEFKTTMIQREHTFNANGLEYHIEIDHHGAGSKFSVWMWQDREILVELVWFKMLRDAIAAAEEMKEQVLRGEL